MTKTDADECADLIDHLGRGTPHDRLGEHVGGDRGLGFEDFGTLVTLRDEVDSSAKPFTERMGVTELRPDGVRGQQCEEAQRGAVEQLLGFRLDAATA